MCLLLKMGGSTVYCAAVIFYINLTVRLQKFVRLKETDAHSVRLRCKETNKRGEDFKDLILQFNLNVASSGGEYIPSLHPGRTA